MIGEDDLPPLDEAALARAEAALSNLGARYMDWAAGDVARLKAKFAEALAATGSQADLCRQDVYAIAHDMKGQAATFGYPLVTEIGQNLCRLLRESPHNTAMIAAHVEALDQVIRDRLSADGGEAGRQLLDSLGLKLSLAQSPYIAL